MGVLSIVLIMGVGDYLHLIGRGQVCQMSKNIRRSQPCARKICASQNANGASNEKHCKAMKEVLSGDNLTISW